MIWGADNANSTELAAAQAVSDTLLGFNEPDNTLAAGGTEITPAQALALWPLLEATGMRLGAPAVASNAHTPNGWLDQFMQGNPSVDFIPLHWYGDLSLATSGDADVAVAAFKAYIEAVWSRYGKPIWVTEFAFIGWDFDNGHIAPNATVQAQFLAAADQMMQTLPYVERWAWFPLTDYLPGVEPASMFNSNGDITPVGTAFKALRGWEPSHMAYGAELIVKIDALTAALDKEDLDDARLVREREEAIQALEEERAKGSVTQADLDKAEAAITQATERLGYNDLLDQSPGEEEPQENEAEDFRPDEEDSK